MSAELKPCPFCGKQPERHHFAFGGAEFYAVGCCVVNQGRQHRTFAAAAEAWNRRAPIAPGAAEGWKPMDDAPFSGLILLRVAAGDEIRVFVAERSISQYDDCWMVTHGWTGWGRMNSSWKPTGWKPISTKVEKEGGSDER